MVHAFPAPHPLTPYPALLRIPTRTDVCSRYQPWNLSLSYDPLGWLHPLPTAACPHQAPPLSTVPPGMTTRTESWQRLLVKDRPPPAPPPPPPRPPRSSSGISPQVLPPSPPSALLLRMLLFRPLLLPGSASAQPSGPSPSSSVTLPDSSLLSERAAASEISWTGSCCSRRVWSE